MKLFNRQKKREVNLYSYYDHAGIVRHLEDMARRGWQLEKAGSIFWHYRRCAPAELHYAVVYFAKASQYDPEPPEEQREFWELCKATGWELVSSRYQMQIFCNPAADPTPIETDPVVQVENVRAAMKKGAVRGNWCMVFCALLQIWLQFHNVSTIRSLLASNTYLFAIFVWIMLLAEAVAGLISYYRWYKKARTAAREEGVLISPSSLKWWRVLELFFIMIFFAVYTANFFVYRRYGMGALTLAVLGIFYGAVLMLVIHGSRWLMKKKGFSAETNMVLNGCIAVVAGLALMGVLFWATLRISDVPSLRGHENAETLTSPGYPDGDTEHTYTVYHDPLPLTVEDLVGETVYKDYSCYREIQGSPLLTEYTYKQEVPFVFSISEQDGPELSYDVYQVGLDSLYNSVKRSFFKDTVYTFHGQIDFVIPHGWVAADAAPWGALDAYQYHDEDGQPYGSYLLCYDSRFVEISFDAWNAAPPTAEQMTLVGKVLGSGPLS